MAIPLVTEGRQMGLYRAGSDVFSGTGRKIQLSWRTKCNDMRHYVLGFAGSKGEHAVRGQPAGFGIGAFIVAEVVADPDVDVGQTGSSGGLASELAGPTARVLTRQELLADDTGRRALEAWEVGDDSEFESDILRKTAKDQAEDERWAAALKSSRPS